MQNEIKALPVGMEESGNLASLWTEYNRLGGKLATFFGSRGAADPRELAHESLFRIVKKIRTGVAIRDIDAYASVVARYVWFEELRKRKRHVELAHANDLPTVRWRPDPRDSEMDHKRAAVDSALMELPSLDRETLLTYYGEDAVTHRELARQLGVTLGSLRVRTCRIREKVRTAIAKTSSFR